MPKSLTLVTPPFLKWVKGGFEEFSLGMEAVVGVFVDLGVEGRLPLLKGRFFGEV